MQQMTGDRQVAPRRFEKQGTAVKSITQKRETLRGEVDADLVSTSGAGLRLHQRSTAAVSKSGKICMRVLAT